MTAHPPERDLEAGQPVPGGRDPYRAAGIGPDGPGREPRGHRDTRAGAAPSRPPAHREVPGVPGRPHVAIGAPRAHREFDGPGLAEHDDPGRDEAAREGRGDRRDAVLPDLRAAGGDAPFEIDDVLERDRHPVEAPDRVAGAPRKVRGPRRGPRFVGVDRDEGVELPVQPLDPSERRFDELLGREIARGQRICGGVRAQELARRHVLSPRSDVLEARRALPRRGPGHGKWGRSEISGSTIPTRLPHRTRNLTLTPFSPRTPGRDRLAPSGRTGPLASLRREPRQARKGAAAAAGAGAGVRLVRAALPFRTGARLSPPRPVRPPRKTGSE